MTERDAAGRATDLKALQQNPSTATRLHSRRSRKGFVLLAVLIVCAIVLPVAVIRGMPHARDVNVASTVPKVVDGYIYQSDGVTPAVGATVIATVWNGTTLHATLSTTSDSLGFYTVTFGPTDWDIGFIIIVGALLGVQGGEGTSVADSTPVQTINVTLGTVIPEFSLPGISVVVAAMIGLLVVVRWRGRQA